jgi:hypothetical protein
MSASAPALSPVASLDPQFPSSGPDFAQLIQRKAVVAQPLQDDVCRMNAMPTIIKLRPAEPDRQTSTSERESWFFIITLVIVFALAAVATVATVDAYGPVFLSPANGP